MEHGKQNVDAKGNSQVVPLQGRIPMQYFVADWSVLALFYHWKPLEN